MQGKTSTAGQDEGVWKLYSESQEIESGITWKLTSATAEELPDSIRINDGVVSWTDQIEAGTYQFYVVATYNDKEVKTNEINLVIHTYVLKNDLEETVLYYDKSSYEEPKSLYNWYLYDEIDQMPIPSLKCQYRLETFGYSSVFSIDEYGFLSWNKNIASKNFNFQVICLYENVEVRSEIYTLSVIDTSFFSYVLNDDNCSYTIFSHKSFNYGELDVLNLPSKYLNLPINKIGDNFLSGCSSFNPTEFTIPETINYIGGGLFYNCYSINCLKVMCSISSLQSSELSFSVDDMTRDVYKNGLLVFVKTKFDLNDFVYTFVNIYDVENKVFRNSHVRVIT